MMIFMRYWPDICENKNFYVKFELFELFELFEYLIE